MPSQPGRSSPEQVHLTSGRTAAESLPRQSTRCPSPAAGLAISSLSFPACRFEDLCRLLHEFVIVLGPHAQIEVLWSSNAGLADEARTALLNQPIRDILTSEAYAQLAQWLDRGGIARREDEVEYSVHLNDGEHCFALRVVPTSHVATRLPTCCLCARDTTRRNQAFEALQRSEVLLAQAEKLANLGSWEYDVASKNLTWSKQFYRMLDFDPDAKPLDHDESRLVIHPQDLESALRDFALIERTGKPIDNEMRFITSKGDVRVFHSRAVAIKGDSGRVTCIRGMSQDVTDQRREEERVRKSEELLAQAEQIAHLGSWEFDAITGRTILSKSLLRLYGIKCAQEFTPEWYWQQVDPGDRRRARTLETRGWRNRKPYIYMVRFRRPNGRTRVHFVRGVPVVGPDKRVVGSIGVVQDITDQRRVVQDLRRLSQEVMRTRDQERRQTARTLHESAGQSLAALKMILNRLQAAVARGEQRAQELFKVAVELTDTAVREVRTVSYLMHPPLLDEAGLATALRWYVTGFTDRSGIEVTLDVDENLHRQSEETETTIYCVVQEALTNIHRYSGSRRAWIRIVQANGRIRMEIRDEGRGIPISEGPTKTKTIPHGVGIAGMRERIRQLGGTFEIESSPERGVTLRAGLPVSSRKEVVVSIAGDESESQDAKQGRKTRRTGAQQRL